MTMNDRGSIRVSARIFLVLLSFWLAQGQAAAEEKKPVTVADAIQMVRLAGSTWGQSPRGHVAQFSPDGKQFTVVVRKGNLEKNTNEYSLLLFKTAEALDSPQPQTLLTMSSSSNRPAIKNVKWLADNDTIAFLGENPGELSQLHTFNRTTKELRKLTNHPTEIVSYDVTAKGDRVVFIAKPTANAEAAREDIRRKGLVISTQGLPYIVAGDYSRSSSSTEDQLFLKTSGEDPVRIEIEDKILGHGLGVLSLSPDGRYAVVEVRVVNVPESWKEYEDERLQYFIAQKRPRGVAATLLRYMLLDIESRLVEPLLDSPIGFYSRGFAWAPDSQSVAISGIYLPLYVSDPAELKARKTKTAVVEVKVPSKEFVRITNRDLRLVKWNQDTNKVVFEPGRSRKGPNVVYRKTRSAWEEVEPTAVDTSANTLLDVILEEDLNTPPKVFAVNPQTGQKALLLDLNPQFSELNFGKVEHITWKATDGHEVEGGLYRPPNYVPGKRYPLVIQTHGWHRERFWIDGPFTTAFAAQPLANKGIVVLQVGGATNIEDRRKYVITPDEAPRAMAEYEGAVDYLDSIGLIDRNRVGLIGFSRTCFYLKYALTHSKYRFAAATVADGIDAGYFQYMSFSNSSPGAAAEFEAMNGGPPFGDTLASWLKSSPGFNLHKVRTPVRIEAISGVIGVLSEWEWFSGLSRLGKPVDMIYIPDGFHMLVKPWERMTSQQGNVDWFTFWLKGEEDPDPAKAEQYERWRALRKQHQANQKKQTSPQAAVH